MPGVVINNPNQDSYYGGVLGDLLKVAGSQLINGMFERDAAARQYKYDSRMADDAEQRRRQGQEYDWNFMTGTQSPWIEQNVNFSRDDPSMNGRSLLYSDLIAGPENSVGSNFQNILPAMLAGNVNLGDRNDTQIMDPMTGEMSHMLQDIGVDPGVELTNNTNRYVADSDKAARLGSASIAAEASRYDTATRMAIAELENQLTRDTTKIYGDPVLNDAGEYVTPNLVTGALGITGQFAPTTPGVAELPTIDAADAVDAYDSLEGMDPKSPNYLALRAFLNQRGAYGPRPPSQIAGLAERNGPPPEPRSNYTGKVSLEEQAAQAVADAGKEYEIDEAVATAERQQLIDAPMPAGAVYVPKYRDSAGVNTTGATGNYAAAAGLNAPRRERIPRAYDAVPLIDARLFSKLDRDEQEDLVFSLKKGEAQVTAEVAALLKGLGVRF